MARPTTIGQNWQQQIAQSAAAPAVPSLNTTAAANDNLLRQFAFLTLTIAANSRVTAELVGDVIFVESVELSSGSSYSALTFRPDNGNPTLRLPKAGRGIRLPNAFRSAEFYNGNAVNVTLNLYVGFGYVDPSLGISDSPIYVAQNLIAISSSELTRPNNVTPYAAGQVVGSNPATRFNWTEMARGNGKTARITKAVLMKSGATVANAVFRLYLRQFGAAMPSIDQTAYAVDYPTGFVTPGTTLPGRLGFYAGIIDFPFMASEGGGGGSICEVTLQTPIILNDSHSDLDGDLVAQAAYVPAAQEKFFVILFSDRD
jgi:hypothetical protein